MAIAETPHCINDTEAYAFIDADGSIGLGVSEGKVGASPLIPSQNFRTSGTEQF